MSSKLENLAYNVLDEVEGEVIDILESYNLEEIFTDLMLLKTLDNELSKEIIYQFIDYTDDYSINSLTDELCELFEEQTCSLEGWEIFGYVIYDIADLIWACIE